jgi:hypothetical protein
MKLHKNLLYANGLLLLAFGVYGAITAGTLGIGIAFSLLALLNLPIFLIYAIKGNRLAVKTCLLITGVFLLIGFSICSNASWGSFH